MFQKNYKIPFDPESLIKEHNAIEMCNTAESIARNIMLLIMTRKGENRYDPQYGNEVWDIEFENSVSLVDWENIFIKSLKEQITNYEPRITAPKVEVHISYVEHSYDTKKFSEIKRRAKIAISAKIVETGEPFQFTTEIFLSPMSVD